MSSEEPDTYKEKSTLLSVRIRRRPEDNAAIVRVASRTQNSEGLAIWKESGAQERNALLAELQTIFGEQRVSMRPVDDGETTDREITVLAPPKTPASKVAPEDHVVAVMMAVEGFIDDLRMGAEVEDEKRFEDMVKGSRRSAVKRTLDNPALSDGNEKDEALRNLRELRRQHRHDGNGGRGRSGRDE